MGYRCSLGIIFGLISQKKEDWEKELDFVNSIRPNHVELLLEYPISNSKLTEDDIVYLKNSLKDYELLVHAPFNNLSLIAPNELIRKASIQELVKTISIAKELNAKLVTVHAGRISVYRERNKIDYYEILQNSLNLLNKEAEKLNINLSIENLKSELAYPKTLEEIQTVFSKIKNMNFTLDVGHFIANNVDIFKAIDRFYPRIKNIHLHDFKDGKDHQQIGEGILDYRKLLAVLNKKKYDQFLTIEVLEKEEIRNSYSLIKKLLTS